MNRKELIRALHDIEENHKFTYSERATMATIESDVAKMGELEEIMKKAREYEVENSYFIHDDDEIGKLLIKALGGRQ